MPACASLSTFPAGRSTSTHPVLPPPHTRSAQAPSVRQWARCPHAVSMSSDKADKAAPATDSAPEAAVAAAETGAGAGAGAGAAPVTVDPALAKKIIKQVDFYFSAHNLPGDKFLSEQVSKDPEGFVPLEVMLRFNRLKALSADEAVVAAALAGSSVVTVSDDGKRIHRTKPLPKDVGPTAFADCTIYAVRQSPARPRPVPRALPCNPACACGRGVPSPQKGFPDNAELEDIEDTFGAFGKVGRVTMRRTLGRKGHFKVSQYPARHPPRTVPGPFWRMATPACASDTVARLQGSVFVTFEEEETVAKVLEGEVKFMGRPLAKVMRKAEYLKAKAAERAAAGGAAAAAGDEQEDSVHKVSSGALVAGARPVSDPSPLPVWRVNSSLA